MNQFNYDHLGYGVTDFDKRCEYLGFLYENKEQYVAAFPALTELKSFIEYYDVGLPMAYMISSGMVTPNLQSKKYIDETWEALMEKDELLGDNCYDEDPDTVLGTVIGNWAKTRP